MYPCAKNPCYWCRYSKSWTRLSDFHFSLSCIGEGNDNPLQCSCLENPRDWGAWWAAVYGVAQSRTRLSDFTCIQCSTYWANIYLKLSFGISFNSFLYVHIYKDFFIGTNHKVNRWHCIALMLTLTTVKGQNLKFMKCMEIHMNCRQKNSNNERMRKRFCGIPPWKMSELTLRLMPNDILTSVNKDRR